MNSSKVFILVCGVIYGLIRVTHTTTTVITPAATVSKPTVTTVPARWQEVASIPGGRTAFAAVTGRDGRIYALGGSTSGNGYLAAALVYNPSDPKSGWNPLPASMTTPRLNFAAVVGPDGRIYAIGGNDRGHLLNTVEVYDTKNGKWSPGVPMISAHYRFGAVLGPDKLIYAIGGVDNNGEPTLGVETFRSQ